MKRTAAADWEGARSLAARCVEALSPLTLRAEKRLALPDWVATHRLVLTELAAIGCCAAQQDHFTLDDLERAAVSTLHLDLADYAGFFIEAASASRKASQASLHPRLFLWKPLDARLLTADVTVLGGLNEGCWPQQPGPDPWLSRRDRVFVGFRLRSGASAKRRMTSLRWLALRRA